MPRENSPKPTEHRVPLVVPDQMVLEETGTSPTVEVRIRRHGRLIHRELCESLDAAQDIVDMWSDLEGVECEVDDLSAQHGPEDILEQSIDDYPEANSERELGPAEGESRRWP